MKKYPWGKILLPVLFLFCVFTVYVYADYGIENISSENKVVIGTDYQKNQASNAILKYIIPEGWELNEEETQKYGVYAILVPSGNNCSNTKEAITITFQKKDKEKLSLSSLKDFFKADISALMEQFPDMQIERWQPSGINPDEVNFMSIKITKLSDSDPSVTKCMYIDSGDGFYAISLSTESLEILNEEKYEKFFNSLVLVKNDLINN